MRCWLSTTIMVICMSLGGGQWVTAQSTPPDAKFVLQVDLNAFRQTELGKRLLEVTTKMAQEEIGDNSQDVMAKVTEAIGFDPLEEVHSLTVIGSSYERPEKSLRAILQLGKTTGNLEGLLLALPGYDFQEMDGITVHAVNEGDQRAFITFDTAENGDKRVLAATSAQAIQEMLKHAANGETAVASPAADSFVNMRVLKFPDEVYHLEQSANVAKLLKAVSATIGEQDGNYVIKISLVASDEKRAEQIQQLVVGAKALISLLQDEIGDDEEAKLAISILQGASVKTEGKEVTIIASIPEKMIINFLREEADLPL
ncbi:MAG: hypothetical protein KDB22_18505 [Planctomycetales bacterium]|nr:hypothetical protein [Planctomycetales bacterium]